MTTFPLAVVVLALWCLVIPLGVVLLGLIQSALLALIPTAIIWTIWIWQSGGLVRPIDLVWVYAPLLFATIAIWLWLEERVRTAVYDSLSLPFCVSAVPQKVQWLVG